MERKKLIEILDVSKDYNGHPALQNVSMHACCGEIVGLVGENGAGKSTLLKIIMGVEALSGGSMLIRGEAYRPQTPREANTKGVGMVFQEQSLITNLTVGQNIYFGEEERFSRFGLVNYRKMNEQAERALCAVDVTSISPRKYVRDINFAARQMVEIAKVVNQANGCNHDNAVVLLDEPTSVLNDAEVEQLFAQMRKLADNGHAVIFVSHRLDEVLRITERIYVFKDAKNAGEFITADTTEAMLYNAMVGHNTASEYYFTDMQREPAEETVLEVRDLSLFGLFKDVSFRLRKGEILGFCGVIGSGKEELCYALCGDLQPTSGQILLRGSPVRFGSPAAARRSGILMIPQERNIEGVVGSLSISDNINASNLQRQARFGILSLKGLAAQAQDWIERLRIKATSGKEAVEQLSGGNMQKVVFARMLASECDVVLLNHPTRGVDVGAKNEIYRLIREMAQAGRSILLLGDTLDECIEMSNRVLVMMDGKIAGEFNAPVDGKPGNLDVIQCMM